MNMNDRLL
jgi:hypothetical protein